MSRRAVGVATAAAVAAAVLPAGRAVAQAQSFMVFFDRDEMMAPASARRLVNAIKSRISKGATVTLTGHCDAAERDPDKLSLARAMEVHGMLVGMGVAPETKFQIVAKGAGSPFAGTEPNKFDPRNSRVEVAIK
ncbi:MAG: OmpA family protein [Candidatus Odyssella sp.]|nr:OmpA family protein [Candidatus Odyssella sp.]